MNALIVLGSRNPQGQTARTAGALASGLEQAGAVVERVFLTELSIERCRQCDARGWGDCREKGVCVIDDDMAGLAGRMRAADRIAFATPVYFSDLSESMRAYLDRLRRIMRHQDGRDGLAGKPALGICVAGGGGGGAPACALSLEKILTTAGLNVVDMIPVRRQNLEHKLDVLRLTGAWFAGPHPAE